MDAPEEELTAAEALDCYVSRLLTGKPTMLPATLDPAELLPYLLAHALAEDCRGQRWEPQGARGHAEPGSVLMH